MERNVGQAGWAGRGRRPRSQPPPYARADALVSLSPRNVFSLAFSSAPTSARKADGWVEACVTDSERPWSSSLRASCKEAEPRARGGDGVGGGLVTQAPVGRGAPAGPRYICGALRPGKPGMAALPRAAKCVPRRCQPRMPRPPTWLQAEQRYPPATRRAAPVEWQAPPGLNTNRLTKEKKNEN